jgi:hypothetical protein
LQPARRRKKKQIPPATATAAKDNGKEKSGSLTSRALVPAGMVVWDDSEGAKAKAGKRCNRGREVRQAVAPERRCFAGARAGLGMASSSAASAEI